MSYTFLNTVCPRNIDLFYGVIYYIKWMNTSWTYHSKDVPIIHSLRLYVGDA